MDYIRYNEPPDSTGPAIRLTPSSPGQTIQPAETTFISVVFHKT
jgi:hypothetical protein